MFLRINPSQFTGMRNDLVSEEPQEDTGMKVTAPEVVNYDGHFPITLYNADLKYSDEQNDT